MTRVKQTYKGKAKKINIKSNYPNNDISLKLPRRSKINVVYNSDHQNVKIAKKLPNKKVKKA